ncbi:MAG TPA: hypothetical protein VMV83_02475 [Rectinemataceae bacterium]|nr:hypothetical protein [Rectinemataceae bacterium]
MKRGPLFLAAALVEVLRFFILMTFAAALGLLAQRPLIPSFIRYAAIGQLLFVVAYFFLWLDLDRYAAYRPLALIGKILSLAAFVPVGLGLIGAMGSEGFIPAGGGAANAAISLPLVDLLGILILAVYRRPAPSASSTAEPVSAGGPAASTSAAQRGPEDIEKVEDLP